MRSVTHPPSLNLIETVTRRIVKHRANPIMWAGVTQPFSFLILPFQIKLYHPILGQRKGQKDVKEYMITKVETAPFV
jgi:hypothetical protein